MRALSLSQAWDETKAIIMRDGRLFASVALALVALPAAIEGLVSPRGMDASAPWWVDAVMIVASLIALAGQLALIRLALGPVDHGWRRDYPRNSPDADLSACRDPHPRRAVHCRDSLRAHPCSPRRAAARERRAPFAGGDDRACSFMSR